MAQNSSKSKPDMYNINLDDGPRPIDLRGPDRSDSGMAAAFRYFSNSTFHRWRYLILLLAAISNGLLVLVINISVVQVRMVNQTAVDQLYDQKNRNDPTSGPPFANFDGPCPIDGSNGSSPDVITRPEDGPFVWDLSTQSLVINIYQFTFGGCQILGSSVVGKLGPKLPSVIGHGFAALATVLIPTFAWYGWPFVAILRLFVGLGLGLVYPSVYSTVERWTPDNERGRSITLVQAGSGIGNALSSPLAGWLCSFAFMGGWPLVFYVDGFLVLIWIICWLKFVSDSPETHAKISEKELRCIQENRQSDPTDTKQVSFVQLLTSGPIIAAIVVYSIYCGTNTIILMSLPAYFKTILLYDVMTNGYINGYLQIAIILSYLTCGRLDDALTNRRIMSRKYVRKTLFSVGSYVTAAFFVGVSLIGCNRSWILAFFVLSRLFHGFCEAQLTAAVFDMAPGSAGHIMGFVNGISAIATFGIAYAGGIFVDSAGGVRSRWNLLFDTCAGMLVLGSLIFCAFIKHQPIFDNQSSPITRGQKSNKSQQSEN